MYSCLCSKKAKACLSCREGKRLEDDVDAVDIAALGRFHRRRHRIDGVSVETEETHLAFRSGVSEDLGKPLALLGRELSGRVGERGAHIEGAEVDGDELIDVHDDDHVVAVHAVVEANAVYRTITELKSIGASGILVTRIERLMP